ncbi:unnamed protein product [Arabis nemorensis]|uniref:Uncharacterized protein n=1 Tax=Arabis nemorensis TaxID=586526 RepID=A0A565C9I4_9BRAS|nr:unnamed protein product [Arabis nemorensis]
MDDGRRDLIEEDSMSEGGAEEEVSGEVLEVEVVEGEGVPKAEVALDEDNMREGGAEEELQKVRECPKQKVRQYPEAEIAEGEAVPKVQVEVTKIVQKLRRTSRITKQILE